jgi:hypothetical protein
MQTSRYTDDAPRGDGLCLCGCGQPTNPAPRTRADRGWIKGQPVPYLRGHNSYGVDRSGPRKEHYRIEDRGYKTPCWIWQLQTVQDSGYGKMRHKGREHLAHRWYYEQAKGPIPQGLQIDHLCAIHECVNPDHLETVTALVNSRRSRTTKLTDQQGREIEQLAEAGISSYTISGWYGVSRQTVDLIRRNGADGPRRPR